LLIINNNCQQQQLPTTPLTLFSSISDNVVVSIHVVRIRRIFGTLAFDVVFLEIQFRDFWGKTDDGQEKVVEIVFTSLK
jgi:hypothetical protein